jgi:hypothetical protein
MTYCGPIVFICDLKSCLREYPLDVGLFWSKPVESSEARELVGSPHRGPDTQVFPETFFPAAEAIQVVSLQTAIF